MGNSAIFLLLTIRPPKIRGAGCAGKIILIYLKIKLACCQLIISLIAIVLLLVNCREEREIGEKIYPNPARVSRAGLSIGKLFRLT